MDLILNITEASAILKVLENESFNNLSEEEQQELYNAEDAIRSWLRSFDSF